MAAKRTRKLLVWTLCLHATLTFGQNAFQKTFGGLGNETATWVVQATSGYLVTGYATNNSGNQDALMLRLDANGNPLWQKRFGGTQADAFHAAISTQDDAFVAVGETGSFGLESSNMFIVKVNSNGAVLWSKSLGEPTFSESARSIVALPNGGMLISGYAQPIGSQNAKTILSRLDANGTVVWSRSYTGQVSANMLCNYVNGNDIYLSGGMDSDGVLFKVNLLNGDVVTGKSYGGAGVDALSCQQSTADGHLLLADHTGSTYAGSDIDMWVQKVNSGSGQVMWSKVYHRQNANLRGRMERLLDGGFLLTPYDTNNGAQSDGLLAKIDANGNLLWSYTYGGHAADRFLKAIQTTDGGYIAVGDTRSAGTGTTSDIFVVKTNADGFISGTCTKEAGLVATNFTPQSSAKTTTAGTWANPGAITVSALPLNLLSQNYQPSPLTTIARNIPLCPNVPYHINGVACFAPKVVIDTVHHFNSCDTIIHYNLTLNPFVQDLNVIGLCANQTFFYQGGEFHAPATLFDTIPSLTAACDTIVSYVLKLVNQPTAEQTIYFCPGEPVLIDGQTYTQPGNVTVSIPPLATTNGCDTLMTYHLIEKVRPTLSVNISFCPGESVMIGGNVYTQPGTAIVNVPSTNGGCDTVVTYHLSLRPQPTRTQSIGVCPGESVTIGGQTYNQPGTVYAQVPSTTGGCDTAVTYTIYIKPQPTLSRQVGLCPGQTVVIAGQTYNQPGTVYAQVPSTTGGCDTAVTYTIVNQPQPSRSEQIGLCPGQSVTIGGQTYNQPGTVYAQVPSTTGGCDTAVTYTIVNQPQPSRSEQIGLCPGQSVTIGGQTYNQPGTVYAQVPSTTGGCDTAVTYTIVNQPQPSRSEQIGLCPGQSVTIGGQTYSQPGTVVAQLAAHNGGCDTMVTYTIFQQAQPVRSEQIGLCPGQSVTIGGQTYNQPGTVVAQLAAHNGGCDTMVTYTIVPREQIVRNEIRSFCQGESVVIAGQTYNQPGNVSLTLPSSTGGCDTVVHYTLQYFGPSTSHISMACPTNVVIAAATGAQSAQVNYTLPVAASDCECQGLDMNMQSGLPSGSQFPVGTTDICYMAKDKCGQQAPCCFKVTVASEQSCDVIENGCMKYEILSVTADVKQRKTYRIRVTNKCASKLVYTAIQVPAGIVAVEPLNNATYTSPDGRSYIVRSPNYSPLYSVRFKSTADSIANGESEVFEYTLPSQAVVTYINIVSRLENQTSVEAHLNTFNCPVGVTPNATSRDDAEAVAPVNSSIVLFPNPTTGVLFADLSDWQGQNLDVRVNSTNGQLVFQKKYTAQDDLLRVELPAGLSNGVYFFEIANDKGEKQVERFVLEKR